ncbi:MAG TPA: S-layer homology domain-containing protein [Clostridiales bacterium]|nr:S-layer homology domain-containing protein [Clostridiales bacterium]
MKSIRRNFFILLLISFLIVISSAPTMAAAPSVNAYSAVVMDCDTGAFYYTKDADTMRVPASMTKLMTAYIIFEELDKGTISKNSVVTVSAAAARVASTSGYSNVPLSQGEKYTVDTMLKLMLIPSACGACHAMAEYISGSEAAFVARMNSTAASLGMKTAFTNCHGAINHYVTARSMALLAYHFLNNYPDILNYTSLQAISFKGTTYRNTNKFLSSDYYAGVDGLKTGTSSAAGSCMTVTAKQNNRRIITVVMHSSNRYGDTRALLDYGFSSVKTSDAAAASASLVLSSVTPAIRLGADFSVKATVSQTSVPFVASGGWQVNGTTVATFENRPMQQGTILAQKFNLDAYAGGDVTVALYLNLSNGATKTVSAVYSFSADAPCAFRDIDQHWAEDAITQLKNDNAVNGYADGSFRPGNAITRAEFVTALVRTMAAKEMLEITDKTTAFGDVQGTWSEKYVAIAAENNIIDGYPDGSFRPDQNITRQEIAVIIGRAFQMKATGETETSFSDNDTIASWAKAWVAAAAANGVISGYNDHSFRPANNATRAESAALLMRSAALFTADEEL